MKNALRKIIARLQGKDKDQGTRVDIISYPKCGRTWLRVLIGKALCDTYSLPEDLMLDTPALTAKAGISSTKFNHDVSSLGAGRDYREMKADKSGYKNKKVIFLVRDVKDVLVSSYFHATKRKGLFKGSISEFIRSDNYGARKIVAFYNIWHANQNVPKDFLLVRYEDLHADPNGVLKKVLGFMGIEGIDDALVENAVAFARFENMKKMEKDRAFKSSIMVPADENDTESFKVRKGKVGGYRKYLSDEDIQYIDEVTHEMGCPFNESTAGIT